MEPTIGYYLPCKKYYKLHFEQFLILCKRAQIKTIEINDDYFNSIHSQSPPNIIVHKLTDILCREVLNDDKMAHQFLEKFRQMKGRTIMIDNLESISQLLNRHVQYSLLKEIQTIYVPPFISITDEFTANDCQKIQQLLTNNNIQYPIICKPIQAHGSESHNMKIIFDSSHLIDIQYPCILQQFINHDGILFKIFLVGINDDNFYIVKRSSIRNFTITQSLETISFHSSEVSSTQACSNLNNGEDIIVDGITIDNERIKELVRLIKKKFELNLLGIDVIINCQTQQYAVIDVNYFPGYEGMKDFNQQLFNLCENILNEQSLQLKSHLNKTIFKNNSVSLMKIQSSKIIY